MPYEQDVLAGLLPSIAKQVRHRVASLALPEDVQRVLAQVIDADMTFLAQRPSVIRIIPTIQHGLEGDAATVAPFHAAWLLMYAAVGRLDHLQDGDATDDQLPLAGGPAAQYNGVLGTYALAAGLLNELVPAVPERVLRLHRLWSDCSLRMAAGQQRDLALASIGTEGVSLEDYQQIALMKTGAMFALAFSGTALLLTDDMHVVNVLAVVGEIYGALLQYGDDVLDAEHQPNGTATLPSMIQQTFGAAQRGPQTPTQFWSYLYPIYRSSAIDALAGVQPPLREAVLDLFAGTFEAVESR